MKLRITSLLNVTALTLLMSVYHVAAKDNKRVYPGYDAKAGCELAGFVWLQGWNDMVDREVYPNRGNPGGYDQYSEVLAHFIRDVRKDLAAPNMPLVIGVMGVGGPIEKYGPDQQRDRGIHGEFRKAMAAPAAMPEFEGNVTTVLTEEYWDLELTELAARWDKVRAKSRSLNQDKSLSEVHYDPTASGPSLSMSLTRHQSRADGSIRWRPY